MLETANSTNQNACKGNLYLKAKHFYRVVNLRRGQGLISIIHCKSQENGMKAQIYDNFHHKTSLQNKKKFCLSILSEILSSVNFTKMTRHGFLFNYKTCTIQSLCTFTFILTVNNNTTTSVHVLQIEINTDTLPMMLD